jgi:TRAP-type mannitol/chloroaromatic compound transport system permease small subunit
MAALAAFVRTIDRLNDAVGRGVAWLTLAMVLITFAVVLLRYVFAIGWVWMQESYVWLHGIVFMLGAGYTLLHQGHVRVDIFYRDAAPRRKALVDLFGSLLLLLPVVGLIFWVSLDYVADSWGLFLLKTVILGFCVLLGLQGLSLAGRSLLVLRGPADIVDPGDPGAGREAGGVA